MSKKRYSQKNSKEEKMSKNEKSIKPDFKESVEYHLLLDDLMQKLESPEHQFSGNVSFYYREKQKKSRKRK